MRSGDICPQRANCVSLTTRLTFLLILTIDCESIHNECLWRDDFGNSHGQATLTIYTKTQLAISKPAQAHLECSNRPIDSGRNTDLPNNLGHHAARDIRQAKVATGMTICQTQVIESQQMQQCSV